MPRSDAVPQTIGQAKDWGWAWLTAKCLSCRHSGQIKLDADSLRHGSTPLAVLAGKIVCGRCGGRTLEFGLGAYVFTAGQPWQQTARIAFCRGATIEPPRE